MRAKKFAGLLSLTAALIGASVVTVAATPPAAITANTAASTLTLEALFRAEPYRGEVAKEPEFSHSGRYLAYRWNPFGEPGSDLYVYDTKTGKTQRLTSRALMAAFDAPEDLERFDRKLQQKRDEQATTQAKEVAQQAYLAGAKVDLDQWERAAIEKVKLEVADKKKRDDAQKAADKADAELEKAAAAALAAKRAGKPVAEKVAAVAVAASAAASAAEKAEAGKDKALWEWRDELKKSQARNKLKDNNKDLYPGVSQIAWAHEKDELVFQYRGGLFRWVAGSDRITPLQATQRELKIIAYTADDLGYVFTDDTRVLRARFAAGGVDVLNRELIHPDDADRKYKIEATTISEDGRWMALVGRTPLGEEGKPAPAGPTVEIMNYNERWATAKKVPREVSDNKRAEKPYAVYIRRVSAPGEAPHKQAAPVLTQAGGDGWFELSPIAWARDGSRYVFTTWEREKELLKVYIGTADENAKPEVVLERRGEVGHEVVNVLAPRFTPDGKTVVLTLDEAGFRQPYAIDVATRALKPLLKGDFEATKVLGFTPDSKTMFVAANKGDFAAMNVYRVNLADGGMTALGAAGDFHRDGVVSYDGRWLAANAGNWAQRPELKLLDATRSYVANAEKTLTDSHDKAWAQVDAMRPERFAFKNRHGDTIEAYAFKPAGWKATDRRPAVVYVYGGPLNDRHIVEVDSFQQTGYVFAMYMAAKHGYVTVAVDPRGHSHYGRKFSGANWEQVGAPQAEDLEDLHKLMASTMGVDGARVGLTGWSFGGFQTQYTMYTKPDLFAAGIAGAGPTEWENYNSWYSGRTIGKVDRTKPVLRKYSLLPLARNLKKPLLLVHGMVDPNVLYQDTVNVYRELLTSGKDALVDLYLDPEGAHSMGGAVKSVGLHRKYEAYWVQHLGVGASKP